MYNSIFPLLGIYLQCSIVPQELLSVFSPLACVLYLGVSKLELEYGSDC